MSMFQQYWRRDRRYQMLAIGCSTTSSKSRLEHIPRARFLTNEKRLSVALSPRFDQPIGNVVAATKFLQSAPVFSSNGSQPSYIDRSCWSDTFRDFDGRRIDASVSEA